ncbi:unnamed protein product [Penicillium olsonii]|nr:unnamed protein product [Penicillium olsonii]CAG7933809.1 unnamed protein product [Penicillium olsonii]
MPSPPPSAGIESPDRLNSAMATKIPRGGPPSRIDPSVANQPYLQPNMPTPASSVAPSPSINSAPRSPLHAPYDALDKESDMDVFSFPMPGNRLPTQVRTPSPKTDGTAKSLPPVPSSGFGDGLKPENIQLPLSPMPPKSPDTNHHRGDSTLSHSSYRSSFASSRYGDSTARSSSNGSSRGTRSFGEEAPPVPVAPLRTLSKTSFPRDSNLSVVSSQISEEEASGFDFGLPGPNPVTGLHDLPEESPSAEFENSNEYPAFQPSTQTHLHPAAAAEPTTEAPRKNSDASTASALSVTSFARALGLDDQMNKPESSVSSDSSPSEARSGSSVSSLPSDASLTRHKTSDPLNLGVLVEELPARTRQTILELPGRVRSTMEEVESVPPIPAAFFSPDSPTDPSINQGGLSLIADRKEQAPIPTPSQPKKSIPPQNPPATERTIAAPTPQITSTPQIPSTPQTPATPQTPSRSGTRSKGKCKGCNETITGKSISSSDGRLTGRYHRGCFVCFECHSPFQTADFYVLNNRPFCAQHYHERNGSLCAGCHTGIEGHYLETVERNPARADRRRFHTECLQCRTCHVLLKGDYFEWNGEVFCERDARRAAAASHPPPGPGRRRPTLGSSPLAHSGQFPPGPYPPGPGHGPGLRPGPRFPPGGGGGRFPERRTTRLMMV